MLHWHNRRTRNTISVKYFDVNVNVNYSRSKCLLIVRHNNIMPGTGTDDRGSATSEK